VQNPVDAVLHDQLAQIAGREHVPAGHRQPPPVRPGQTVDVDVRCGRVDQHDGLAAFQEPLSGPPADEPVAAGDECGHVRSSRAAGAPRFRSAALRTRDRG
jgi:hypothetical protein